MKAAFSSFCLLIVISFFSCSDTGKKDNAAVQNETATSSAKKHFVFVPGSFHASWCWNKMQPLLSNNGNYSVAIDLPAHGNDTTSPNLVTLNNYVDAVCLELEKYNEPVILIGHSRAGIVISQVAEKMPDKIDKLVYLCAFLIPDGEPMIATALTDSASLLVEGLIFNETEGWHFPKEEIVRDAFYHDCSEEDVTYCKSLLTKEPNAPVATPLQLSAGRYGKVYKAYIYTTEDKAISYNIQKKMVSRVPVDTTFELNTGHSPFLANPKELAGILLNL